MRMRLYRQKGEARYEMGLGRPLMPLEVSLPREDLQPPTPVTQRRAPSRCSQHRQGTS